MIEKLMVFDFDGTLFKSPPPYRFYKGETAEWYRDSMSLNPPVVPSSPGEEWFFSDIVDLVRESSKCLKTYSVLMTGRRGDVGNFHSRIREILASQNLRFDEIYLKPKDMKTVEFKSGTIFTLAHNIEMRYGNLKEVHIFDDRHHHLPVFKKKLRLIKGEVITHAVGVHNESG